MRIVRLSKERSCVILHVDRSVIEHGCELCRKKVFHSLVNKIPNEKKFRASIEMRKILLLNSL